MEARHGHSKLAATAIMLTMMAMVAVPAEYADDVYGSKDDDGNGNVDDDDDDEFDAFWWR